MRYLIYIFLGCFAHLLYSSCSFLPAHNAKSPYRRALASSMESYHLRPDIFQAAPNQHDLGKEWQQLKMAQLETLAMVIEMYPDREVYFLARDSELLFDQAKLLLRDNKEQLDRLHLLNVSRANLKSNHLKDYLIQEGISEERILEGKKPLFLDTGFKGTIPRVIGSLFSPEVAEQMETQLLCSDNKEHPSSRSFLSWLNPYAFELHPGRMHGTIISYENIDRYNNRSHDFEKRDGQWRPISTPISSEGKSDGKVSKERALKFQEDLVNFTQSAEAQSFFEKRRQLWRELFQLGQEFPKEKGSQKLRLRLQELVTSNDSHLMSLASDFLDLTKSNRIFSHAINITPEDIGIELQKAMPPGQYKSALLKKYPEWKDIFSDPENGIRAYFKEGNAYELGRMIDIIDDEEFIMLFTQELGAKNSELRQQFIDVLLEKDERYLSALSKFTFSQESAPILEPKILKLISKALERKRPQILIDLSQSSLSKLNPLKFTEIFRSTLSAAIELNDATLFKASVDQLKHLSVNGDIQIFLDQMINGAQRVGDRGTFQLLAQNLLSQADFKDSALYIDRLIDVALEQRNGEILSLLAVSTFSKPHQKDAEELILKSIDAAITLKDSEALKNLAVYTFSQEHTKDMNKALESTIDAAVIIKKPDILRALAFKTFSQSHTKELQPLLLKTIAAAITLKDDRTLFDLVDYTFSKGHTKELGGVKNLLQAFMKDFDFEKLNRGLTTFIMDSSGRSNCLDTLDLLLGKS